MHHIVHSVEEADALLEEIEANAARTQIWLRAHDGTGMELLRAMKFDTVGFHPMGGHALNAIEQINQTFTYAVAVAATRHLLEMHPEAGGFRLAPGAHMSLPLDIMSVEEGLVGAETFAAVDPRNNRKLAKDLAKLADRAEFHRYVFFASPLFPGTRRQPQFDAGGTQVWSVDV